MQWFRKAKSGIGTLIKKDTPVDLWVKCEGCKEVLYRKELAQNFHVCEHCKYHFRVGAGEYVKILVDAGTWQTMDTNLRSVDPLKFSAKKKYRDSLSDAEKNTGVTSGVVSGTGEIGGHKAALAVMDFRFIGGSMGSVEGEKIARVFRKALQLRIPAIVVSASGGARMQEGALSLMQMASTSACIAQLQQAHLPFLSVMTNPTMGGVTASFAMLGDVHIAEPGALIGFAGERVIRETIRQALPAGFQRAEFLMEKGFIDLIVPRPELKETIAKLLSHLYSGHSASEKLNSAPSPSRPG